MLLILAAIATCVVVVDRIAARRIKSNLDNPNIALIEINLERISNDSCSDRFKVFSLAAVV
ncbi:MAG TPA: hypothetical protein DCE14_04570 [Kosmotogaceae bacterium]|nr:hypothetical protein [Kosmotogaceae bacterium]